MNKPTARLIADDDGLAEAARLLATGEVLALPTETVYGLAADARNGCCTVPMAGRLKF